MGTVVVDTSIVVALLDSLDAHHVSAREALVALTPSDPDFRLSAVVLAEALVGAARISAAEFTHTNGLIREAFGPVYEVDGQVAATSARLRATHPWLRLPDALILATAEIERADVVLTADKRWAKVSATVRVVGGAGPRSRRGG